MPDGLLHLNHQHSLCANHLHQASNAGFHSLFSVHPVAPEKQALWEMPQLFPSLLLHRQHLHEQAIVDQHRRQGRWVRWHRECCESQSRGQVQVIRPAQWN